MEDERHIPYNRYQKVVDIDGSVNWKHTPKGAVSLEHIKQLMEVTLEKAKELPTEDKGLWFCLQIDKDKRAAGRGNDIFSVEPILLLVEREHFLRDSFEQFKTTSDLDLRRDIKIHFLNEICQDAGGLIREWFSVLIEDLFDPKFHLFTKANTKELSYLFNEYSGKYHEDHLDYFFFCGQVIAKALYERIPIKAYLNKIILKQLLGHELAAEDMKYCDYQMYTSIQYILTNPISNEDHIGTFTISKKDPESGNESSVELKENGTKTEITDSNKVEFAELFFKHSFVITTETQAKSFIGGFTSLLPRSSINVFDPDELELFICGETTLDVKDWKENTTYGPPYNAEHPVIVRFWEMVEKMEPEERERLLQFCTGSKRVPAEGFKALRAANNKISKFKIEPRTLGEKGAAYIVAHTCFNKLELPMYADVETMKGYVNKVLESPAYFQFTFE